MGTTFSQRRSPRRRAVCGLNACAAAPAAHRRHGHVCRPAAHTVAGCGAGAGLLPHRGWCELRQLERCELGCVPRKLRQQMRCAASFYADCRLAADHTVLQLLSTHLIDSGCVCPSTLASLRPTLAAGHLPGPHRQRQFYGNGRTDEICGHLCTRHCQGECASTAQQLSQLVVSGQPSGCGSAFWWVACLSSSLTKTLQSTVTHLPRAMPCCSLPIPSVLCLRLCRPDRRGWRPAHPPRLRAPHLPPPARHCALGGGSRRAGQPGPGLLPGG